MEGSDLVGQPDARLGGMIRGVGEQEEPARSGPSSS
jgi:hypothetical protein